MRNSVDRIQDDKENEEPEKEILTLFGIHGPVGTLFCKLALSAGYHISALSPTLDLDFQHECLTVQRGDIGTVGEDVLQDLLQGATYCVCLPEPKGKEYPPGRLYDFHERLHPLFKECPTLRLFLYQVSLYYSVCCCYCVCCVVCCLSCMSSSSLVLKRYMLYCSRERKSRLILIISSTNVVF